MARSAARDPGQSAGVALASATVHLLYSIVLQRGYRVASFSVVYPTARGSGPLFNVLAALGLWSERSSALGWAGVAAILGGLPLSARGAGPAAAAGERPHGGVRWGLLTGLLIATYTLLDAWAVKALAVSPVVFYTLGLLLGTLLLAPLALRQRGEIAARWRERRAAIIARSGCCRPCLHARAAGAADRTTELRCAGARGVRVGRHAAGRTPARVRPAQAAGTATMLLGVVAIALA